MGGVKKKNFAVKLTMKCCKSIALFLHCYPNAIFQNQNTLMIPEGGSLKCHLYYQLCKIFNIIRQEVTNCQS